jgi:2-oxoglutarate dehydrogenase E2 component (dihydrolipoamide succinyltransferase)
MENMFIELIVPAIGESISEIEIGEWLKSEGEFVEKDEDVVVLETEKATVELPAPMAGLVGKILKRKGETAKVGEVIGSIQPPEKGAKPAAPKKISKPAEPARARVIESVSNHAAKRDIAVAESQRAEPPAEPRIMPSAQRLMATEGVSGDQVTPTGPGGRTLKEDVLRAAESAPPAPATAKPPAEKAPPPERGSAPARREEAVRMSRLRRTVAERLVSAQQNAALLTTFNEIDMSQVLGLRKEHGEAFKERYGVKLGFMSFFVKAVIDGLRQIPQLNAEIRETDLVYRHYYDIGIAIGGGKGLVVPVLRNAELLSFAEVEKAIGDFAARARENALTIEELTGGTFTITNGGIYGSLLSTPIINPPQSGVLGMHAIQERPVAEQGQVVIRPMMYVALTYDHRVVDGREAVTFLKRLKDAIENPARMLLEI